jgi:hypothetical protein
MTKNDLCNSLNDGKIKGIFTYDYERQPIKEYIDVCGDYYRLHGGVLNESKRL